MEKMTTSTLHEDEIREMIEPAKVIPIIEQAFVDFYQGKIIVPFPSHFEPKSKEGVVHMKPASDDKQYVIKTASYFPGNEKKGLSNIQGSVTLYDAGTGFPLVVIFDNALLTHHRTAAAGAIGAKYLSRPESSRVFVVGAGTEGKLQIEYLQQVREISEVGVFAREEEHKRAYVESMQRRFPNIKFFGANSIEEGCDGADIIVTTTPNKGSPLIQSAWVKEGVHINAIGSDGPGKQELDPNILARAIYVTDSTKQCEEKGELQHARVQDIVVKVHAEIGAIIAGDKNGRIAPFEITVFDSTGLGAQDLAIAQWVKKKSDLIVANEIHSWS